MKETSNHYTFGESDLAAQRLAYLAAAYERPTRAFLQAWGQEKPEHALDLGCGPGHTTLLLQSTLQPRDTTGLDASDKLLGEGRRRAPGAVFVRHDVTRAPFPCAPADLLFCRFLLTHLGDPGAVVRAWATAAKPGARLLIQETESLDSDEPAFARYYALVGALQAGYGQSLHVGAQLDGHVTGQGWTVLDSTCVVLAQDPVVMARLHAMNIRTWSQDAMAKRSFDPDEVARVQSALDAIAAGERSAGPVRNGVRQLVAVRES
jgi:trans-aconitate 2-methyltransferase